MVKYNCDYTVTQERLFFSIPSNGKKSANSYNVEVINNKTGEIIARGYNLSANKSYKTAINVQNMQLELNIWTDNQAERLDKVIVGSTSDKNSDVKADADFFKTISSKYTTYTTGIVPKNINGSQGQIMATHVISGSGHRQLKTKFSSGTNGMDTVNMSYYFDGIYSGFYLTNISVGDYFKPSISFGTGYVIDIKMSTNSSNQGKATLKVYETMY